MEWGKPQGARAINVSFNHRPYINPWTGEPKAETRPEKKPEWSASMDSGEPVHRPCGGSSFISRIR